MSVKQSMDNFREKNDKGAAPTALRDAVIGRALAGRLSAGEGSCPSAGELALLIDGVLEETERDRLLGHLACCGRCREMFVTVRELESEEVTGISRRSRFIVSSLAATAVLALLAIRLAPEWGQPARPEMARKETAASPRVARAPVAHPPVATLQPPEAGSDSRVETGVVAQQLNEPLELLTAEEAAGPTAKVYGFAARERSDGPAIVIDTPQQDGEDTAVTKLRIKFIPRQGNRVDLATLKVECLKETPIDLTPRIKPYLTDSGISVKRVRAPEGVYRIRVTVADYLGRLSEKEFALNVSGSF